MQRLIMVELTSAPFYTRYDGHRIGYMKAKDCILVFNLLVIKS